MQMVLIAALALTSCSARVADNSPVEAPKVENRRGPETWRPERPADEPGVSYGGMGEPIRVGNLTVRPIDVTEDSRYPVNVDCVWSGQLVMRVAVSGVPGEPTVSTLEPLRLPGGGRLAVVSVWPPNVHGETEPLGPYRFGFRQE